VGTAALLDRVRELAADQPLSPLAAGEPTLSRLIEARLEGDALATAVIDRAAVHLGIAIAGLVNLMNPSEVVLGGSLLQVGRHLIDPLRVEVEKRTLIGSSASTEIRASRVGFRDIALGAATLVLSRALEDPDRFLHAVHA
jgi:predicted NBD/HSP70 family sugar kinase